MFRPLKRRAILPPRRLLFFCRSAPNDPEEKHVQASEEDHFLPNKGSYRNNSSPASFCIRPARSLCVSDGKYTKVPETAYATARAR